jgi:hypothetical protein
MAGFWNLPNTFATLTGNQPASLLDENFNDLAIAPQYSSAVSGVDNIVLTTPLTFAAYVAGMSFIFTATGNNTGAMTVNVNSLGAVTLYKNNNQAMQANDVVAGGAYQIYYDGTNFHLLNPTVINVATQNKIINPGMVIDQRFESTGNANPLTNEYTIDRWLVQYSGVANPFSQQQSADVPSNAYAKSLLSTVVTQDNAIAAGDSYGLCQKIEGYDIVDLIGATFTLGFWVKSNVTGTYCVSFRNSAANYSYVATYSISVANTWEYKTITITNGLTSLATWLKTNGVGLIVSWALAVGSTYQTTAGTWAAGNYLATSAQTNWMATAANQFRITGVQLSLGSILPQWESRSIAEELDLCQRYYQKNYPIGTVPGSVTSNGQVTAYAQTTSTVLGMLRGSFATRMRATPTVTWWNPVTGTSASVRNNTAATNPTATGTAIGQMSTGYISLGTAPTANDLILGHWTADAEL